MGHPFTLAIKLPKGAGVALTTYEPLGLFSGPAPLKVTEAQIALAEDWTKALEAYATRDWTVALNAMTAFAKKHPQDNVVKVYLDRIVEFELTPPADDWDGVTRFTEK